MNKLKRRLRRQGKKWLEEQADALLSYQDKFKNPHNWKYIDAIPDFPDEWEKDKPDLGSDFWPVYLSFHLMGTAQLRKTQKAMEEAGFVLDDERVEYNHVKQQYILSDSLAGDKGDFWATYYSRIWIQFHKTDDSQCEIVPVGEKEVVQKVTIYEAICPEGAEEKTWDKAEAQN